MLVGRVVGNRHGKYRALIYPRQRRKFVECNLTRRQSSCRAWFGWYQWELTILSRRHLVNGKVTAYRNIHLLKGVQTMFECPLNNRNQRTTSPNVE